MKKLLICMLVLSMVLSVAVFPASAAAFSDLEENHWAYANVQELVAEGTVGGYEDGTFRPNGTVTRAEFVKMVGESTVMRAEDYDDVPASHWAYSYIMKSDFPQEESNTFQPNLPITRGLAAELLWRRNGAQAGVLVPGIITMQYGRNTDAIAWAYATGLMQGDDGVNLRTEGTLSRAEAAALIVRARQGKAADAVFAETVSPQILANIHNGLWLFDGVAYEADKTVTNGQVARAALYIGNETLQMSYGRYAVTPGFEHPYAKDVAVVFGSVLGKAGVDARFADATATFGDTVAALASQFIEKANQRLAYGAQTEGLPAAVTSKMNSYLTFAKQNGIITLQEDLNASVTQRDFAALCLLFDCVIGTQSDITTDTDANGKYVLKDHSLLLTTDTYGDFRVKLRGLPEEVYSTPFKEVAATPTACYDFTRDFASIYIGIVNALKGTVKDNTGADVRFTYYPSLVAVNNNGYSMRIACDIVSMDGTKTFEELFPVHHVMKGSDTELSAGDRVYFDLATGETFTSIMMSDRNAYVEQIICVER